MALFGGAAGDLEPDPNILGNHRHSRTSRLAGLGPCGAIETSGVEGGGLLRGGAADGGPSQPHHRAPPTSQFHEPSYCVGVAFDSNDDPGRDGSQFPRSRFEASGHQLGRVAHRGSEHRSRGALSMAFSCRCCLWW